MYTTLHFIYGHIYGTQSSNYDAPTRLMYTFAFHRPSQLISNPLKSLKDGRFDSFRIWTSVLHLIIANPPLQCHAYGFSTHRQSCGYSVIRAVPLDASYIHNICGHRGVFMYQIRLLWITGFRPPHPILYGHFNGKFIIWLYAGYYLPHVYTPSRTI